MREVTDQDRLMRRFLLDRLDLQERERMEEQFLIDGSFKEQLLIAEEALIEDYLDNFLDDDERVQFDSVFLSSPQQREKLAIAKAIRVAARSERSSQRFFSVLRAAAAAIAIIVIVWLIQYYFTREERTKHLSIQAELTELNSRSGTEIGQPLILAPVNTRGSGAPILSKRTDPSVADLWLVPTFLDYANFKVLIRRDGDPSSFEVSNLQLTDRASGRGVHLKLPIHRFDPGTYQLELSAIGPKGDSVFAGEYRFQLVE